MQFYCAATQAVGAQPTLGLLTEVVEHPYSQPVLPLDAAPDQAVCTEAAPLLLEFMKIRKLT